jgi:hypothetical protein
MKIEERNEIQSNRIEKVNEKQSNRNTKPQRI